MSCSQCGIIEGFTEEKKKTGCAAKKSGTSCLWDAQGVFMCIDNESGMKPLVPNKDMAMQVYEMKNQAQYAASLSR